MKVSQLHESQHYRKSFFTAIRALFGQKSQRITLPEGVRFADMALFLPFLGLILGFITMVAGMLSVFAFKSNFIGASLSLCFALLLTRTFFSGKQALSITLSDAALLVLWVSLFYTAYERTMFLPIMASFGFGFVSLLFACGLGKDLHQDGEVKLCGRYRNEDLFIIIFQLVMIAVVCLLSLENSWYWAFVPGIFISGAVPHLVAKAQGGVTLAGLKRSIILTSVLSLGVFLLV